MNNIPPKLRIELATDPYYKTCARAGWHTHECAGRITWEHALTFKGRQIQARFAIVPLCAHAHAVDNFQDGGDLDKNLNMWIALCRATDDELLAISKAIDYFHLRASLCRQYGYYEEPILKTNY